MLDCRMKIFDPAEGIYFTEVQTKFQTILKTFSKYILHFQKNISIFASEKKMLSITSYQNSKACFSTGLLHLRRGMRFI